LKTRRESDKLRYAKYFNIDVFDVKNYDFVLDTTNLSVEQVFTKILEVVESKQKAII
jgi:cytidylate kinase